jgi:hypothetical protein
MPYIRLTASEKASLKKHMKALDAAQSFFHELETKYEGDGEPVDGSPIGPFGDAAEALAQIGLDF